MARTGVPRYCRGMGVCKSTKWKGPWTLVPCGEIQEWTRIHTNGFIHIGPLVSVPPQKK